MCFSVVLVGKEQTRKVARVSLSKFNQGCLLFLKEEHFFESFLDPQISFARIL